MTIPAEEEFERFKVLMRERLESPSMFEIDSVVSRGDVRKAIEFIQLSETLRRERSASLRRLPVYQWLEGQNAFQDAIKIMIGRRVKPIEKKIVDYEVLAAKAMVASSRDRYGANSLHRLSDPNGRGFEKTYLWQDQLITALREYFYHQEAPRRMVEAIKRFDNDLKGLQSLCSRVLSDAEILNDLGIRDIRVAHLRNVALSSLERHVGHPTRNLIPFKRVDGDSRERLFVFRMWFASRRQIRKTGRQEAIVELMHLEGFSRAFSLRSVMRLSTQWEEMLARA